MSLSHSVATLVCSISSGCWLRVLHPAPLQLPSVCLHAHDILCREMNDQFHAFLHESAWVLLTLTFLKCSTFLGLSLFVRFVVHLNGFTVSHAMHATMSVAFYLHRYLASLHR